MPRSPGSSHEAAPTWAPRTSCGSERAPPGAKLTVPGLTRAAARAEGFALPPDTGAAFARWLGETVARHSPPLRFAEVRKGVQALSSLYVERRATPRGGGGIAARATDGAAKRAALATFYAPLHFLVAHAASAALGDARVRCVHDLGCGTGAAGAAVARALAHTSGAPPPALSGLDVSGWSLGEARATWRAFGVRGRGRRGALPGAFPKRVGGGDVLVLAFVANELAPNERSALFGRLREALARGAGLLLLEPLARDIAPWWDELAAALVPLGATTSEPRAQLVRPAWIARLDEASGLDHRELGARALVAPPSQARGAGRDHVVLANAPSDRSR